MHVRRHACGDARAHECTCVHTCTHTHTHMHTHRWALCTPQQEGFRRGWTEAAFPAAPAAPAGSCAGEPGKNQPSGQGWILPISFPQLHISGDAGDGVPGTWAGATPQMLTPRPEKPCRGIRTSVPAQMEKLLGPPKGPKPLGGCHSEGGILSTPGMKHRWPREPSGLSPLPLRPWAPLGARSEVPMPTPCPALPRPPSPTGTNPAQCWANNVA